MDQTTQLKYLCSFTVKGVAVGGTLMITKDQLTFNQDIINQAAANRGLNPQAEVALPTSSIVYVGIEDKTMNTTDGGLRRRLRIDSAECGIYLFVLNDLDERIIEIKNMIGADHLEATPRKAYVDPTKSEAYKDEVAETLKIPKNRTIKKLFFILLAVCIFGPFLAIPFKTTVLPVILGVMVPAFAWILLISYIDYRSGIKILRSMFDKNRKDPSVNVDSTAKGVSGTTIIMFQAKIILKILGGVLLFMLLGTITAGIANGIIEGM